MVTLPFIYMDIEAVLLAGPYKSRSTLYAKIRAGEFPEPDHIGSAVRWRSDRVAEWLADRAAKADAERSELNRKAQGKAKELEAARRRAAARRTVAA